MVESEDVDEAGLLASAQSSQPLPTGLSPPHPHSKPVEEVVETLGPDFPTSKTSCLLGLHEA